MNKEKEKATFVFNLNSVKKREIKTTLMGIKELRQSSLTQFETLFINPIKQNIKFCDDVLKGKLPIEFYMRSSRKLTQHLKDALKCCGDTADKIEVE